MFLGMSPLYFSAFSVPFLLSLALSQQDFFSSPSPGVALLSLNPSYLSQFWKSHPVQSILLLFLTVAFSLWTVFIHAQAETSCPAMDMPEILVLFDVEIHWKV